MISSNICFVFGEIIKYKSCLYESIFFQVQLTKNYIYTGHLYQSTFSQVKFCIRDYINFKSIFFYIHNYKMTNSNIIITTIITSFCIGFCYLLYKNNIEYKHKNLENNNNYNIINNSEYEKMYKIIEITSELDKDPYKRKISPKVVIKFCKIAKSKSINLDTINNKQFDLIYKTYTEYLIKKYEKKIKKLKKS